MSKAEWEKQRVIVEKEARKYLEKEGLSQTEIEERIKEGLREWEKKNKYIEEVKNGDC